jgi:hypothetical protein
MSVGKFKFYFSLISARTLLRSTAIAANTLLYATNFLAAFAKPLLCDGRIISTKFNLKTE